MPTPSAPDPHAPYTFSSTCPDTDESSRQETQQHNESRVNNQDDAAADTMPIHARDSSPIQTILTSNFADSDGPVPETDESSSPLSASMEYHKPADDEGLSHPPYGLSSIEPIEVSRPRQGVGTTEPLPSSIGESAPQQKSQDPDNEYMMEEDYSLPSMGFGFPSRRTIPNSPSAFLRAGSRFTGTQQSERQVYQVEVEVKYVDLGESFLCGYLRIQGLTDDHPTLTTYFEGEIIGSKYGFLTKHADWGANDKTDLSHWSKFPAFRPYSKQARRNHNGGLSSAASALHGAVVKDVAQSEHIFMRWKEHFLVPDHRVRTITGASFEGFYYICFNQVLGEVNGIYFHSKSERFQQLELKHVENRGCYSALEFR